VTVRRASRRTRGVAAAVQCLAFVAMLAAAACTSTRSPYLLRRDEIPVHVVQSGETLYKIAWQYRVDERDLVAWNDLQNPDALRVGQRLRLVPPRGYVAPPPAPVVTPTASTTPPTTRPQSEPRSAPRAEPPARRPASPPPRAPAAASAPAWSWPTEGRVVAGFGSRGGIASGIAIAGRDGQPVRAAAAGRVVYAGGGLIGYGQLVIIKHDETFLSAYGYNSNLLVTQGQDVARGATIALMGQGPERQPRLHFEIRRNGIPVDPLLFVAAPR
jgi:lipoprotein NlpD